jgi:hypothetical protein
VEVLGIVPVLGRGRLPNQPLGPQTLQRRAVGLLRGLCSSVIAVDHDLAPESTRALPQTLRLPADEVRLRREVGSFDRVIIHDPVCPLVSSSFARRLLDMETSDPIVAVRPVIDTVKAAPGGVIAHTMDRDGLRVISSPIVLDASDLLSADDLGLALADLTVLVEHVRVRSNPRLVTAPSASRRVEDISGLRLAAAIEAVAHRIRERD